MPPPRYHDVGGFLPTCTAQAGYIPARYSPDTLFATWGMSFLGARVNFRPSNFGRPIHLQRSCPFNGLHSTRDQCSAGVSARQGVYIGMAANGLTTGHLFFTLNLAASLMPGAKLSLAAISPTAQPKLRRACYVSDD
ncbi:hypothetical protein G6F57_019073 [Rhizopus arrhizus]|nr:hypothetical protein G6F57_019073 [Rhizopus arrhizus]